jgi:hypothetical protein
LKISWSRIDLISGRKHRAQLSAIGVDRGDIKWFKTKTRMVRSISSYKIHFNILREEILKIVAPLPEEGLWKYVSSE